MGRKKEYIRVCMNMGTKFCTSFSIGIWIHIYYAVASSFFPLSRSDKLHYIRGRSHSIKLRNLCLFAVKQLTWSASKRERERRQERETEQERAQWKFMRGNK